MNLENTIAILAITVWEMRNLLYHHPICLETSKDILYSEKTNWNSIPVD